MKQKLRQILKTAVLYLSFCIIAGAILDTAIIKAILAVQFPQKQTVCEIATSTIEIIATSTKEAVKEVSKATSSVKDRIIAEAENLCNKYTLGDFCVKDLLGMAWTESRYNDKAIGDGGKSHGLYQIHLGYHPDVTVNQAEDIRFATEWTLKRLLHFGYPEYRSTAIQRHNGTPGTAKTISYLESVNSIALK